MAVCFEGGVVLGADSRTSTGSYVANRVSDKIVPIHDFIWTCRSGSAADTQAVADYVKFYVEAHRYNHTHMSYNNHNISHITILNSILYSMELGRLPRVRTVANLMRKICYNNKDNLMAGLIVGGWDPYEGGQVYEIPLGGTIMKQKFAIGGSGSTYIYGLVDAAYKEGMTKEECQTFVKKCKHYTLSPCLNQHCSLTPPLLRLLLYTYTTIMLIHTYICI